MRLQAIAALCIGFQITGCAISALGEKPDAPTSVVEGRAPLTLIASDFVHAIIQLESLPPYNTTVDLQQSERADAFTLAMQHELQQAGYATRWVANKGAGSLFQYRLAADNAAASANREIYELAVGVVEMRRSYVTDKQQRVRPVSPLYIRGTDASGVVLNDEKFELADIDGTAFGLQNSSTLQVPVDANPLDPQVGKAASGGSFSLPLVMMPKARNVFNLGGSNFQSMLGGHTVVAEQILTFANDSMNLGGLNKQLIEKLVARFDPQTDVFSVIGCSMGPTQVRGGNAALALGRAGRVVEALRFAGVDDERILDEGCWAGDGSLDNLPRRGVVLTLNRRA